MGSEPELLAHDAASPFTQIVGKPEAQCANRAYAHKITCTLGYLITAQNNCSSGATDLMTQGKFWRVSYIPHFSKRLPHFGRILAKLGLTFC